MCNIVFSPEMSIIAIGIIMRIHIAILKRSYLSLILTGQKRLECRLTKISCPPFGQIAGGEKVLLKEFLKHERYLEKDDAAIRKLAKEIGAQIPTLLMLDSPMKNISERENRDQFAAFHKMLLELSVKELANTQIFVVDKELFET